jgi:hypothetical protein
MYLNYYYLLFKFKVFKCKFKFKRLMLTIAQRSAAQPDVFLRQTLSVNILIF